MVYYKVQEVPEMSRRSCCETQKKIICHVLQQTVTLTKVELYQDHT